MTRRPKIELDDYVNGVREGSRAWIGRAITLVESTRPDHRELGQRMLVRLTPHAGGAVRVGITGVPGVGKSTFIDALGTNLTAAGHRVAVLAVDPSSTRTGGSVLGDKTRMARLAVDPAAFIRPSPTAGTLGGVAKATREAMVVVEAAGYDVVLVETVGVGQSETTVAEMVDSFLFLTLARTGDQLQGIKKGVLELADVIAVNKADGPHEADARKAARELAGALRMLRPPASGSSARPSGASARPSGPSAGLSRASARPVGAAAESAVAGPATSGGEVTLSGAVSEEVPPWLPPVLTCSARENAGLDEVWAQLVRHRDRLAASGELAARRRRQQIRWTWAMVEDRLLTALREHPAVRGVAPDLERQVAAGEITPAIAAERILSAFSGPPA